MMLVSAPAIPTREATIPTAPAAKKSSTVPRENTSLIFTVNATVAKQRNTITQMSSASLMFNLGRSRFDGRYKS
jgi:hypothetical protein